MAMGLNHTPSRYGLVSRSLHWASAYLLLWQFLMALGWRVLGEENIMRTVSLLGPAHATVGVLVLTLVVPRIFWAFLNRNQRPAADASLSGLLARIVSRLFYLLMVVVPALALVRAYGSGTGYALWGIQLILKTGQQVHWLKAPADLLHAPLAWMLSFLISGHILMALFHAVIRRDETMSRML